MPMPWKKCVSRGCQVYNHVEVTLLCCFHTVCSPKCLREIILKSLDQFCRNGHRVKLKNYFKTHETHSYSGESPLQDIINFAKSIEMKSLRCPSCSHSTPLDQILSSGVILNNFFRKKKPEKIPLLAECDFCAEIRTVKSFCDDCYSLFCKRCADAHKHVPPEESDRQADMKYWVNHHDLATLNYYCKTCDVKFCGKCGFDNDHDDHITYEISKEKQILLEMMRECSRNHVDGHLNEIDSETKTRKSRMRVAFIKKFLNVAHEIVENRDDVAIVNLSTFCQHNMYLEPMLANAKKTVETLQTANADSGGQLMTSENLRIEFNGRESLHEDEAKDQIGSANPAETESQTAPLKRKRKTPLKWTSESIETNKTPNKIIHRQKFLTVVSKASLEDPPSELDYPLQHNDHMKLPSNEGRSDDFCTICRDGGDIIICCDDCPKVFHPTCHIPAIHDTEILNGNKEYWQCNFFETTDDVEKRHKAVSKNNVEEENKALVPENNESFHYACRFMNECHKIPEIPTVKWRFPQEYLKKYKTVPYHLKYIRERLCNADQMKFLSTKDMLYAFRQMFIQAFMIYTDGHQFRHEAVKCFATFRELVGKYYPRYRSIFDGIVEIERQSKIRLWLT